MHRLHPYLGKFPPQLAEVLLRRRFAPGALIYDPFAGSGTTLVEATVLGMPALGCDVSAFNCLLAGLKIGAARPGRRSRPSWSARWRCRRLERPAVAWLAEWYAPQALHELFGFREAIAGSSQPALLSVVLSRAARSARRVPHHALDETRRPVTEPYWCHKHRRQCRPVEQAAGFLRRYAADSLRRLEEYAALRAPVEATVLHADARSAPLPAGIDGVVTSPPYPGLIDYHEQHRYAYELLGLDDRREPRAGCGGSRHRPPRGDRVLRRHHRGAGPHARPSAPGVRRWRSWSTTAATSTTRSPAAPASGSRAAPPATSTAAPAAAPASTSRTCCGWCLPRREQSPPASPG